MAEPVEKQSSGWRDAFASGCVLLLVLVADVVAALVVVIVLAVRDLGRMDAAIVHPEAVPPPADWAPALCFGGLALAVGLTGVVLLRLGVRVIGAVQLALCVVLACCAVGGLP